MVTGSSTVGEGFDTQPDILVMFRFESDGPAQERRMFVAGGQVGARFLLEVPIPSGGERFAVELPGAGEYRITTDPVGNPGPTDCDVFDVFEAFLEDGDEVIISSDRCGDVVGQVKQ